jgi:hypothetical protein
MNLGEHGVTNGFMVSCEMAADLTNRVAKEFGWEDLMDVDGWEKVSLKSAVGEGSGTLKPNAKSGVNLDFVFDSIKAFRATEADGENGKRRHEVRFMVRSSQKEAMQVLDKYWRANKDIVSAFSIKFQELLDQGKTEDETKATAGIE